MTYRCIDFFIARNTKISDFSDGKISDELPCSWTNRNL